MADEHKKIIEINGVKVEVDLREAKTVDTIRVGDKVKLLKKGYGDSYEVFSGVVVGFEAFEQLPAIVVAYMKVDFSSADLQIVTVTHKSKDIELVKSDDDILFSKEDALRQFNKQIEKKRGEISEIEEKIAYFEKHFGTYWHKVQPSTANEPF